MLFSILLPQNKFASNFLQTFFLQQFFFPNFCCKKKIAANFFFSGRKKTVLAANFFLPQPRCVTVCLNIHSSGHTHTQSNVVCIVISYMNDVTAESAMNRFGSENFRIGPFSDFSVHRVVLGVRFVGHGLTEINGINWSSTMTSFRSIHFEANYMLWYEWQLITRRLRCHSDKHFIHYFCYNFDRNLK